MEAGLFADTDVISSYTTEQAVEDGVLVKVGMAGDCPIFITRNCFEQFGLADDVKRWAVTGTALAALRQPHREDDEYRKLRVIKSGEAKLWVIHDGQGVTIMMPEDY